MTKTLYFICPTDCLEPIINYTFQQENYYYSSLGNSTSFDSNMLVQIKELIKSKNIDEILFILSNNNRIISDAIGKQCFSEINGLSFFYNQVIEKSNSKVSWKVWEDPTLLLSHLLNIKIKELTTGLRYFLDQLPKISGKIYDREEKVFLAIHSDLICKGYANFN